MKLEVLTDIKNFADNPILSCAEWNRFNPSNNPFCRYEFLSALESSGSCTERTGWQPHHLVIRDDGNDCIAIIPSYLKTNSNGEYVFDWAWADAYQRHGFQYYPKLLSAIPFTPSAGPRILTKEGRVSKDLVTFIREETITTLQHESVSSWHLLFPDMNSITIGNPSLVKEGQDNKSIFSDIFEDPKKINELALSKPDLMLIRQGTQFQWMNHGYQNFEDFLDQLTSRKRKNIRKERQKVTLAGVECQWLSGDCIDQQALDDFYLFYQLTYLKRGQRPYLNKSFFQQIVTTMPQQIKMVLASYHGKTVAGSLFFYNETTLFGRYWGCTDEFRHLHFECCYYQGIDYAIDGGLQRFDAGAQGEHKIQRGFEPIPTWSLHWINHSGFRKAIADFVNQEQLGVSAYMQDAADYLPFKKP